VSDDVVVPSVRDNLPSRFYSAVSSVESLARLALPAGVGLAYGCNNCDWRELGICPLGFVKGSTSVHRDLICPERAAYLKGFYRGSSPVPSFTEWEADYSQGVAMKMFQYELSILASIDSEIDVVKKRLAEVELVGGDDRLVKDLRKRLGVLDAQRRSNREQWFALWKTIRNLQETRLNREAPKKIEVTHRDAVSVDDFNRIMRKASGSVVDTDYEVLE